MVVDTMSNDNPGTLQSSDRTVTPFACMVNGIAMWILGHDQQLL